MTSDFAIPPTEQRYDFFFYGTLCVPAVLIRVLGHKCDHLTFQDALLPDYTRHRVKDDSYPAIISKDQTISLAPNTTDADFSVRGTLARGLSYADVLRLDTYEGDEYSRAKVTVDILSKAVTLGKLPEELVDPTSRHETETGVNGVVNSNKSEAWTYVWNDTLDRLVPEIWTFDNFIQAKASDWSDLPSSWFQGRQEEIYTKLGVDGTATEGDEIDGKVVKGFPTFGHDMLKYWGFRKGYVNLNHGSYGSPPIPVLEAIRKLSAQCEERPDHFMRAYLTPSLTKTREQVSALIGAERDEVVMVPNTTHGVNTIMSNLQWDKGDVVVIYSTTYGAVGQMAKYFADVHPEIKLEFIDLEFPTSHVSILDATKAVFDKYNEVVSGQNQPVGKGKERVKLVIVDAIASMPGVMLPWEDIVGLSKKYGVLSLVDAAHALGQIKVDVKKSDPDFWVSNCHKWFMTHRGNALLYVPYRNQHLIRTTLPTSAGYESCRYPTDVGDQSKKREWSFVKQFDWTGTNDFAPLLSIPDAINFRQDIGGEDRIMKYNHDLAVQGGKRVAKKWNTKFIENEDENLAKDGELTVAMANVELPHIPRPKNLEDMFKQYQYLMDGMHENNCFAAVAVHAGKWFVRLSAQVWLELKDFDYVADVLEKLCKEIKEGRHLDKPTEVKAPLAEPSDLPVADDQ